MMAETEQPAPTCTIAEGTVPTIDLRDPDEEKVTRSITEASREWGFFQVVNHGIPTQVIKRLQAVGTDFFQLPQDEKQVYAKAKAKAKPLIDANSIEGYATNLQLMLGMKSSSSWGDHLFHRIWPPSRINYHFWPKNPPSYREVNEEYSKYVREVADKVFKSLSLGLGLGLEENALKEAVGGEEVEYLLKINYYPPCPHPDLAFGVPPHTDLSALTILVPNDVPGLQVFKNDNWIDVPYIPNALVIHIGDQIEVASNGFYKAVLHRTRVNKERARLSWPVFLEPPPEFVVGPIPQLLNQDIINNHPPKYKSEKFKDYAYCKLNSKLPQGHET
ncbi:Isopenicillin N synthase [Trema orientale]|uniref:Isopenicillin N synthase n=1 Tax=Trema orientale TaxID=63057 RepID=A0A2P5EEK3_TREOI|nr:Isopenicillin N synthase [Trema orientale]